MIDIFTKQKQITNFLKEIEKLKNIKRIIYLSDKKTLEDDTQHTWHMAMILLCFKNEIGIQFDVLRAMKMILIHDLGEIYTGDIFVGLDKEAKKVKDKREKESLNKILSLLPNDLQNEFELLIDEYEDRKTIESRIVKAIDTIQYKIQFSVNGGIYEGKEDNKYEWNAEKDRKYHKKNVEFNEYFNHLMEELRKESDIYYK